MPAPSKRDRQSMKRFEQNRTLRTRLKSISRDFYRALDAGDEERARNLRDQSQRVYAKAASRGVIHPNKASRKTSRLDRALARALSGSPE